MHIDIFRFAICVNLLFLIFSVRKSFWISIDAFSIPYHQVVLEGQWKEGFMALAAIGATNIGSVEVMGLPLAMSL